MGACACYIYIWKHSTDLDTRPWQRPKHFTELTKAAKVVKFPNIYLIISSTFGWLDVFRFLLLECGGFCSFWILLPHISVFLCSKKKRRKIKKWNDTDLNYLHRWLLIICLIINQRNYNKATDNRSFVKWIYYDN